LAKYKSKIVFIATNWGAKYGGINSFNTDICCALTGLIGNRYKIICIVLNATKKDMESAKQKGVILIPIYPNKVGEIDENWLDTALTKVKSIKPSSVYCWIGHDVKTGFAAIDASKKCDDDSFNVVIHHMDYQSYSAIHPESTFEKVKRQNRLLSNGDFVFAVGPLLEESAKDKVSDKRKVFGIVPGLPKIRSMSLPTRFSAITFGRLNLRADRIKQGKLAVAGFARACRINKALVSTNPSITAVGLSQNDKIKEEIAELRSIAQTYAGRAIQVHPWPYIDDREELHEELRKKSVSMMLSIHEGFGLVGWEAIAAEVPLVVTRNSGLFSLVDRFYEGPGTGCLFDVDIRGSLGDEPFNESDVDTVADALLTIYTSPEKWKRNAHQIKMLISKTFTWNNAAKHMARILGIYNEPTIISHRTKREISKLLGCSKSYVNLMAEEIEKFYTIASTIQT